MYTQCGEHCLALRRNSHTCGREFDAFFPRLSPVSVCQGVFRILAAFPLALSLSGLSIPARIQPLQNEGRAAPAFSLKACRHPLSFVPHAPLCGRQTGYPDNFRFPETVLETLPISSLLHCLEGDLPLHPLLLPFRYQSLPCACRILIAASEDTPRVTLPPWPHLVPVHSFAPACH